MRRPTLSPEQEAAGYEWQFRCESCGEDVDTDHCYCVECGDHAGDWELVDENGEAV